MQRHTPTGQTRCGGRWQPSSRAAGHTLSTSTFEGCPIAWQGSRGESPSRGLPGNGFGASRWSALRAPKGVPDDSPRGLPRNGERWAETRAWQARGKVTGERVTRPGGDKDTRRLPAFHLPTREAPTPPRLSSAVVCTSRGTRACAPPTNQSTNDTQPGGPPHAPDHVLSRVE